MRDDEAALVVCNPVDADYLIEKDPDISDFLVVTTIMHPGELIMVPMEEFVEYLFEGGRDVRSK